MTDHEHTFPVQPPAGTLWAPGPCLICGKGYDRAQAEKRLTDAQAALAALIEDEAGADE